MISGWTGTVKQIEQMRSSGILSGLRVTGGGVCGLVLDAMVTNEGRLAFLKWACQAG